MSDILWIIFWAHSMIGFSMLLCAHIDNKNLKKSFFFLFPQIVLFSAVFGFFYLFIYDKESMR